MIITIKRFIERLQIWLSFWNPSKNMYDFDFTSILIAEHNQLKRVIKCIDKYRSHINSNRDLFWMKICDNLLDIILNDSHYYPDSLKMNRYCNTKNYKRWFPYLDPKIKDKLKYFEGDLYIQKAWYLYHNIRLQYMQSWWDLLVRGLIEDGTSLCYTSSNGSPNRMLAQF